MKQDGVSLNDQPLCFKDQQPSTTPAIFQQGPPILDTNRHRHTPINTSRKQMRYRCMMVRAWNLGSVIQLGLSLDYDHADMQTPSRSKSSTRLGTYRDCHSSLHSSRGPRTVTNVRPQLPRSKRVARQRVTAVRSRTVVISAARRAASRGTRLSLCWPLNLSRDFENMLVGCCVHMGSWAVKSSAWQGQVP